MTRVSRALEQGSCNIWPCTDWHAYKCTCVNTYARAHTYVCTHTHAHTHTFLLARSLSWHIIMHCQRKRACVCVCFSYAIVCLLINWFIDWLLHLMRPIVKGGNAHSKRTIIMTTQTTALSFRNRYSGNLNHAEQSAHSFKQIRYMGRYPNG